MERETATTNPRTNTIDIHVPIDVLTNPEVLPLTLRNIVVLLANRIPRNDSKAHSALFSEYMKMICALERVFRSLND